MNPFPRFVVRVDDVGQDQEQHLKDVGMLTFAKWFEASNLDPYPIYLGVVPSKLEKAEIDWLLNLQATTKVRLALHGWDHRMCPLKPSDIKQAAEVIQSNVVIPPYNLYDETTLEAVADLPTTSHPPVLMGGFLGKDHKYGVAPKLLDYAGKKVIHISATKSLYDRSWTVAEQVHLLLEMIEETKKMGYDPSKEPLVRYPLQIVLHHRWECNNLIRTATFAPTVAPYIVGLEEIWKWLCSADQQGLIPTI